MQKQPCPMSCAGHMAEVGARLCSSWWYIHMQRRCPQPFVFVYDVAGKRCVVEGCKKPAYERNGNLCCLHQQNTETIV